MGMNAPGQPCDEKIFGLQRRKMEGGRKEKTQRGSKPLAKTTKKRARCRGSLFTSETFREKGGGERGKELSHGQEIRGADATH